MEHTAKQKVSSKPVNQSKVSFFSRRTDPLSLSPATVQPKLTIGPVDDPFEKEADAIAEKVVQMPDMDAIETAAAPSGVQRKCKSCEEEEKLRRKEEDEDIEDIVQLSRVGESAVQRKCVDCEEEEPVQRKELGNCAGLHVSNSVYQTIESPGSSMEPGTRSFMESRFNSDFSAVQIHNDALAHRSSAEIKAQAYTFRNHIVFGAGKYQPHTTKGKLLLAHELVHTLQQRNAFGVIRKKPDESIVDNPGVAKKMNSAPQLVDILEKHIKASPSNKKILALAAALRKVDSNNTDAIWAEAKRMAEAAVIPSQEKELDLLFDVYKFLQKYKEAKDLSESKKYLPQKTAFYNKEFYKEVIKGDLAWLPKHPALKDFFPFRFVDTFRMYLFGPFLSVQSINEIAVLKKRYAEVNAELIANSGLIDNERLLVSLEAFLALDKFRYGFIAKMDQNISRRKGRLETKMELASIFADKALIDAIKPAFSEEELFLLTNASPAIRRVAGDAQRFWNAELEHIRLVFKNDIAKQSLISSFKRHKKEFAKFERPIENVAVTYLRLTAEGNIPGKKQFTDQSTSARQDLKSVINTASFELIRRQRSSNLKENELMGLYGTLIVFLNRLYNYLLPSPGKLAADDYENFQKLERIAVGREITSLGTLLGSSRLETLGAEVKSPTGKSIAGGVQKETFLAFGTNPHWEFEKLTPNQTLNKFGKENAEVNESAYLALLMKNYAYNALLKEEIKKLKAQLSAETQNLDSITAESYVPIPNEVFKSLAEESAGDNSVIPRRFVLKDVYFSVPEKQKDVFDYKVRDSERFDKELKSRFNKNEGTYMAIRPEIHYAADGIVIWVVSDRNAFAQAMQELFPNVAIPSPAQGLDTNWFSEFTKLLRNEEAKLKAKPGTKSSLLDFIKATSEKELDKTKAELKPLRRKALSHHRKALTKLLVRPLWDAFQDNVRGISTWGNPKKAIDQMITMAGGHPFLLDEQQNQELKFQITAMLLELAPLIYDRLFDQDYGAQTSRVDLVSTLLPHVLGALSLEGEVLSNNNTFSLSYPLSEHQNRVERLAKLRDKIITLLQSAYENEWLESDSTAIELRDRNSNIPFTKKSPIGYNGKTHILTAVYKNFRYQPSVDLDSGGVSWSPKMIDDANPSKLFIQNGSTEQQIDKGSRTGTKLFTIEIVNNQDGKQETVDVTDKDDERLKEIRAIIGLRSNIKNLETLGEVLETGAEWIKLPFYFIPGLGQAVLAGDIVVGVIQFLTSSDFQFLKRILSGDGIDLVKESFDKVTHLFSIDGLWNTLLDDRINLPKVNEPKMKEGAEETSKKSDGRLRRFFLKLKRFGSKVVNGLGRLKSMINFNIKRARFFLLKRPSLDAAVSFIVKNFHKITGAAKIMADTKDKSDDKNIYAEFVKEVEDMMNHLTALQVPKNLIPLDLIIDIIVRIAMKSLKGPKGIIAGAVKTLLEKAGIYQRVVDLVSKHLQGSWIDPNQILNEIITDKIQPMVQRASDSMADGVRTVLKHVPGMEEIGLPKAPRIKELEDSGEDFEQQEEGEESTEAQPFPLFPIESGKGHILPAQASGGVALDDLQLDELAQDFGQNFSHVRLHTDSEANRATEEAGALALTSGSHIYMRSGLSVNQEPGKGILKHELAHVLQQTGPRPFSQKNSETPVNGKPGKGIVFDNRKEEAADLFAKSSRNYRAIPPQQNGSDSEGIHPKFTDVALKFFRSVSTPPDLKVKYVLNDPSSNAVLTAQETALANNLVGAISAQIPKLTLDKAFTDAKAEIIQFLQTREKDWGTTNAFTNMVKLSKEKKKQGLPDTDQSNWILKTTRLQVALEEFMLVKTGIVLDIRLKQGTMDIIKFDVENMFLEHVKDKNIWNKIITNTFAKGSRSNTLTTTYKQGETEIYVQAAQSVLSALETKHVFANEGFRFTNVVASEIEKQVHTDPDEKHAGTKEDPIPIRWTKTGHADPLRIEPDLEKWNYNDPPLDLSERWVSMKSRTELQISPGQVRANSFPNAKKRTINNKNHYFISIGVDDKFLPRIGKKMERIDYPEEDRGGIIDIFKTLLRSHSFNWENPVPHSPDHLQDMGWGGKPMDVLNNLWPLESKKLNETEGNAVYNQEVYYKEGAEVKKGLVKGLYGKWFIIKSIGRIP